MNEIRAAFDREGRQSQRKFHSRLKTLSQLPYTQWTAGGVLCRDLHGDCAGLTEIRFLADNVQQRPLGFRSGPEEFTIVLWAHEKGGKWEETNACSIALQRKHEIEKLKVRTDALWLPLQ